MNFFWLKEVNFKNYYSEDSVITFTDLPSISTSLIVIILFIRSHKYPLDMINHERIVSISS